MTWTRRKGYLKTHSFSGDNNSARRGSGHPNSGILLVTMPSSQKHSPYSRPFFRLSDKAGRTTRLSLICLMLAGLAAPAFSQTPKNNKPANQQGTHVIKSEGFGKTQDGQAVDLYTLTNKHGMEVRAMTYGAIIVSLQVPDKNNKLDDVVLGFDNFDGYLNNSPYLGAIVGRYGNRIANGKFKLNGVEYTLAKNNGPNSLHGGLKGFDKRVWQGEPFETKHGAGVKFTYMSKDGEEGYPGNLKAEVTYTLPIDKNELEIEYHATTDKPTVLNLTNHSYFNLAGEGRGDVLAQEIMLRADKFTPVDATLIPTGELLSVKGTPMDLTKPTPIGLHIDDKYEQLTRARGWDHNFVVNGKPGELRLAARAHDPKSGRVLEVLTTQPGVQFYSGNFLDGTVTGKHGHVYQLHYGFCLETQHFPDSPNHPEFPTTTLKPGETFHSQTVFRFSVE